MSKCEIIGCRKKANMEWQDVSLQGRFDRDSVDLCFDHGMMGRNELRILLNKVYEDRNSMKDSIKQAYAVKKKKAMPAPVLEKLENVKDELTLENYKELTGKRFRMTKEQKKRGLSRLAAFNEFMESL